MVGQNVGFNPGSRPVRPMTRTEFVEQSGAEQGRANKLRQQGEQSMKTMRNKLILALALVLACTALVFAQKKPAQNVSPKRHPNLAAAQKLSANAYQKVLA